MILFFMYYFNFESKYITHMLMAKVFWIILCTHDEIQVVLLDCTVIL